MWYVSFGPWRVSSWPISFPNVFPSRKNGRPPQRHPRLRRHSWPEWPLECTCFSKGNRSGSPPKTYRSCWVQTLSGSDFPLKKGCNSGWGGLWIFFVVFMVEIKPPQVPNTKNNIEYRVNGHETCRNTNPGYCCLPVLSVASWKLTLFTIIYIRYGGGLGGPSNGIYFALDGKLGIHLCLWAIHGAVQGRTKGITILIGGFSSFRYIPSTNNITDWGSRSWSETLHT